MKTKEHRHRGRSIALPLILSLVLHGLLGVVSWWTAANTRPASGSPVDMDMVVLEDEEVGTLEISSQPSKQVGRSRSASGSEEQEPIISQAFPTSVIDPPSVEDPSVAEIQGVGQHQDNAVPGTVGNSADGGTGPRAGGPGQGRANGSGQGVFPIARERQSVVYVIDRSNSMGLLGGLGVAKREVLASLANLPSTARFQIVFYNSHTIESVPGRPGLLNGDESAKELAMKFVDGIRPKDGTMHLEGLREALSLRPDLVILVTDADDLDLKVVDKVTRLNQGKSAIHAIELTSHRESEGEGESQLAKLAARNRGTYRKVALTR